MDTHCHLIVSRKDQSNKKKLSQLANHKNTDKGVIKGASTEPTFSIKRKRVLASYSIIAVPYPIPLNTTIS